MYTTDMRDKRYSITAAIASFGRSQPKEAETRTGADGRKFNLLQAIRTPSYTAKPPSPPKKDIPDVQYGTPRDVRPSNGSSGDSASSSSSVPAYMKQADFNAPKFDRTAYLDRMYHIDGPADHQTPSGNPMYDDLPAEQRAQQTKANDDAFFRRAYARRNLVGRNTIDQTKANVDAAGGVGNWGNGWLGKAITRGVVPALNAVGKGVTYVTHAPKGTSWKDWSEGYDQAASQNAGQLGHDIANNFQLQANALGHGAGQVLRFGASVLDPRTWGGGIDAEMKRMEYDNAMANASDAYHERADRIANNFEDKSLNDMNSGVGRWNYGLNAAVGEFAGGELATAGVGAAAKGIGRGIQAASNAGATGARYLGASVGSTARNLEASRQAMLRANGFNRALAPELRSAKAFRMQYAKDMNKALMPAADEAASAANKALRQQWMQRAGQSRIGGWLSDRPSLFIQGVGDTLSAPFNIAGSALSLSGQSAAAEAAGRPLLNSVIHPVRTFGNARSAIANAARHPLNTVWRPTKKLIGTAMSPQSWGAYGMYSASRNAAKGNYAGALQDVGTLGYYNAAGIPGIVAGAVLGGAMGGGDGE